MKDETGEVLDWYDAKRAEIVALARAEVGPQGKGSQRVIDYWRAVALPNWTESQIRYAAKHAEWCGVFALWCLREALGLQLVWHVLDGQVGFVGPLRLPRTSAPKPGDIAITPVPFWHHAIVEELAAGVLKTIDGNQPDVRIKVRPLPRQLQFHSIDPLLERALAEGGK